MKLGCIKVKRSSTGAKSAQKLQVRTDCVTQFSSARNTAIDSALKGRKSTKSVNLIDGAGKDNLINRLDDLFSRSWEKITANP